MILDITLSPSPNFDKRREGAGPDYIIFHFTGTANAEEAANVYLDGKRDEDVGRVSPHYMIDEGGRITRFVDEKDRAWHAGLSYWQGLTDMNSHSIGIELVNEGYNNNFPPFPIPQIESLKALSKDIMRRHGIPAHHILGHSDIAPGRKNDPGPAFPWRQFAREGIGVWPDVTRDDAAQALEFLSRASHEAVFKEHLIAIGYNPESSVHDLRQAFDMHYCPANPDDEISLASMLALLRALDNHA